MQNMYIHNPYLLCSITNKNRCLFAVFLIKLCDGNIKNHTFTQYSIEPLDGVHLYQYCYAKKLSEIFQTQELKYCT